MVEPLSLVTTILAVVHLIGQAALTARQNKRKCTDLAERATNLGEALPSFEKAAAANDRATVHGLERLHRALSEALKIIDSCKAAGIWSGLAITGKAADLDNIDRTINSCLTDLNFFSLASRHAMSAQNVAAAAAGSVPAAQTSYYQPQGGGASSFHAAWSQHAWSTQQGYYQQTPGYYQQPPGYVHWVSAPASPYTAYPAHSGSNRFTFLTLPTVNRIFKHMRDGFH